MPQTPALIEVVLDTRTGQRGEVAAWVSAFQHVWTAPGANLERLLALMSEDVVLRAPTTPPVSRGRAAGRAAFTRALRAMPDLRAEVLRWSSTGDTLFIEMTFHATVGGAPVAWGNVDRFIFRDGQAIERLAYFDPSKVRKHFLRSPAGWRQLARMRLGM